MDSRNGRPIGKHSFAKALHAMFIAALLAATMGCMHWAPGLSVSGYGPPGGDAARLLDAARRLESTVDTREGLREMVRA